MIRNRGIVGAYAPSFPENEVNLMEYLSVRCEHVVKTAERKYELLVLEEKQDLAPIISLYDDIQLEKRKNLKKQREMFESDCVEQREGAIISCEKVERRVIYEQFLEGYHVIITAPEYVARRKRKIAQQAETLRTAETAKEFRRWQKEIVLDHIDQREILTRDEQRHRFDVIEVEQEVKFQKIFELFYGTVSLDCNEQAERLAIAGGSEFTDCFSFFLRIYCLPSTGE